ncbi:MAG TPA: hypothetical protein VFS00_17590 [Polyangiaceae bacterium]|nr:hypothetical protein [Polyangiaceae bacterium]
MVHLLAAAIVILPGTAHSTLPPPPASPPPVVALAAAPVEATPAPEAFEAAPTSDDATPEAAPAGASPEGDDLVECPVPGKRQNLQGKIDPAVIRAAGEHLEVPLGKGRRRLINGRAYLFCLEMHYREPGSGPGPQGWHRGVTVYAD